MFPAILIQIVVVLLVAGLLLWGVKQFPIDATIQRLIHVVVIVVVCLWLIYALFGMFGGGSAGPVFRR